MIALVEIWVGIHVPKDRKGEINMSIFLDSGFTLRSGEEEYAPFAVNRFCRVFVESSRASLSRLQS